MLFAEPATQPDIIRDPLWQFIGVILALIGIITAFIIFYLQRQKKSLAYEIETNTPVLTIDEQVAGKVKVLYENKPIKNAQLIVIKLINNGNQPITSNDYERNFSCTFGKNSKILSSEIIKPTPEELKPKLLVNENLIILEPLLLNKKDFLIIKTLVADFKDKIDVDARIIGVNKISQINQSSNLRYFYIRVAIAIFFSIVGGIFGVVVLNLDFYAILVASVIYLAMILDIIIPLFRKK